MLVRNNLDEFRNPETGGYSEDQIKKDYEGIIRRYKLEVTPEGSEIFYNNVIFPEFENGRINSEDDLEKIVIDRDDLSIAVERNVFTVKKTAEKIVEYTPDKFLVLFGAINKIE